MYSRISTANTWQILLEISEYKEYFWPQREGLMTKKILRSITNNNKNNNKHLRLPCKLGWPKWFVSDYVNFVQYLCENSTHMYGIWMFLQKKSRNFSMFFVCMQCFQTHLLPLSENLIKYSRNNLHILNIWLFIRICVK